MAGTIYVAVCTIQNIGKAVRLAKTKTIVLGVGEPGLIQLNYKNYLLFKKSMNLFQILFQSKGILLLNVNEASLTCAFSLILVLRKQ